MITRMAPDKLDSMYPEQATKKMNKLRDIMKLGKKKVKKTKKGFKP